MLVKYTAFLFECLCHLKHMFTKDDGCGVAGGTAGMEAAMAEVCGSGVEAAG